MRRLISRAAALVALMVAGLLPSAPATAQVDPVEPYFVTVSRDGVPLKCRDGSPYYAVKNLSSGQVLKVDGQSEGWVRVEYPPGLLAFARPEEVAPADSGKVVKLTKPSRLMAANVAGGERGSWWYLLDADLPAGTSFVVAQTLKNPDGKEYGYLVPAPKQARGYVKREFVRKATTEEIDAYNRSATGSPGGEPAKPKTEAAPTKPAESKPAVPAKPVAGAPQPTPAKPVDKPVTPPAPPPSQPPAPVTPTATVPQPVPGTPTVAPPPPTGTGTNRPIAKLDVLSALYDEASSKPVEQAELDTVIAEFQRTIDSLGKTPDDERLSKQLAPRLKVLKMRAELQASMKKNSEVTTSLRRQSDEVAAQVAALNKLRQYDTVGKLVGSTVYDGKRLPLMYRIVSAEPTSARTLAYIAPRSAEGLSDKIGRVVGVAGDSHFDPSLRVNIITPVRIDILTATGEVETITPGAPALGTPPAEPKTVPDKAPPDENK